MFLAEACVIVTIELLKLKNKVKPKPKTPSLDKLFGCHPPLAESQMVAPTWRGLVAIACARILIVRGH